MKSSADMLAADLRRMAGLIPVGWRAVAVLIFTVVVFPLLITAFVLDALTYEMPVLRAPVKRCLAWLGTRRHPRTSTLAPTQSHPLAVAHLTKVRT